MVPVKGFSLEEEGDDQSEHDQRDDLLDDFQLKKAERAAVAREAEPVGRHLGTIFKKSHTPGEEDNQNQRPVRGNLHFLQLQVAVPSESHEYVGQHQQQNSSYSSHIGHYAYKTPRS